MFDLLAITGREIATNIRQEWLTPLGLLAVAAVTIILIIALALDRKYGWIPAVLVVAGLMAWFVSAPASGLDLLKDGWDSVLAQPSESVPAKSDGS